MIPVDQLAEGWTGEFVFCEEIDGQGQVIAMVCDQCRGRIMKLEWECPGNDQACILRCMSCGYCHPHSSHNICLLSKKTDGAFARLKQLMDDTPDAEAIK